MNEEEEGDNNRQLTEGSSASTQQRTELMDSFGESIDDDDYNHQDTDRLLPYSINNSSSSSLASIQQHTNRNNIPASLPVSTDGVFMNISAKPESDSKKLEETPPVSLYRSIRLLDTDLAYRHMKKQQQIPHHLIGKLQSLPQLEWVILFW